MTKLAALLLLLTASAFATSYTSVTTGNWNACSTWGTCSTTNRVPGNGDMASVTDGTTVTVNDSRIIGASAASPSSGLCPSPAVALDMNNTGALIIASGGTLTARGCIQYNPNGGANTTAYLTVQAGGTIIIDASQAANPMSTYYPLGAGQQYGGRYGYRTFVTTGATSSHATVKSNSAGAHAYFATTYNGGAYITSYTDFTNIGDANNAAFTGWTSGGASNLTPWIALHDTFANCGLILNPGPQPTDTFQHDYNVHTNSLGAGVLHVGGSGGVVGPTGGAVRELTGNVFDIDADAGLDIEGFTIHSNYFGDGLTTLHTDQDTWWYFQNNFYRRSNSSVGDMIVLGGDARDNLWFLDEHTSFNPHGPDLAQASAETISGNIVDHTGQVIKSTSAFMITNGAILPNGSNYSMVNNILLPNAAGHSSFWLTTPIQQSGENGVTYKLNHNTWMVDNVGTGGAGIYTAHSGVANQTGTIASFQNNILWNPMPSNQAYKLMAYSGVDHNVCLPAACDYNDGYNMLTDGGGYSGGGNGYADVFSGSGDSAPHNMTGDNAPAPFVASASSEFSSGFAAYKAFDGSAGYNQYWVATGPTGWLQIDTGRSYNLTSYAIQVDTVPEPNRAPNTWTMLGSNDGNTWYPLDSEHNQTNWASGEIRTFTASGSNTYRYFRINVTANNGDPLLEIAEVYLAAPLPPGQHDLSANPNFLDPTRNTATFDSAYLGHTAPPWNSAATYTVGSTVSSSDPTVYGGVTINYRYTNGVYHGAVACSGANPQPGLLNDTSRACWEWASLYDLRQGVASQTLYDDQTIGAHGVDIITLLIQWIRTGFSPTNPALALSGSDGQDIGAVPVTFPAASFPGSGNSGGNQGGAGASNLRGAAIRGGIVR
jgi:hypothetical protein